MTGSSEGWFSRLKNGLARTRVNIVGLFSGGVIDDDFLEELEYALITADVGVQASTRILQRLRDTIKLKGLKTQDEVRLALRDEIARMLAPAQRELDIEQAHPLVIMMTGVNGAGKTTVFNLLTNVYQPTRGSILIDGMPTAGKKTYQVNRMGVARTFQNIRLFKEMSVIDNIKVGLHESMKYDLASSLIRLPNYWKEEKHCTERAFELLDIFHMADMAYTQAGSLPYGAQRRLEIMRALATSPKLLLLDEPAAGMNPSETAELTETIRRIRDEFNIAVLLIEHDMSLVMGICEGIAVLNFGRIIAKGTPDEIRNNPQVIEAYLGKKEG